MSSHTFLKLVPHDCLLSAPFEVVVTHFAAMLLASIRFEMEGGIRTASPAAGCRRDCFYLAMEHFPPWRVECVLFRAETIQLGPLQAEELPPLLPPTLSCDEVKSQGTNSSSRLSISVTTALGVLLPLGTVTLHSAAH